MCSYIASDNKILLKNSFRNNTFRVELFKWSLYLLPVGLLFGEVPTSVAEIIVFGCWLLTGQLKSKFETLIQSKCFWLLASIYLLHIVGLIYTSNFNYAFNDLRIKLPLLFFPLIFFSVDTITFKDILNVLKWSFIVTFINLSFLWLNKQMNSDVFLDTRNASVFISHIRLGLIAAFAVVIAVYIMVNYSTNVEKLFFAVIVLGIIYYMISLGLMTGIVVLFVVSFAAIVYMLVRKYHTIYFKVIFGLSIVLLVTLMWYTFSIYKKYFPEHTTNEPLLTHTSSNNPYTHQLDAAYTENGHYVFINICDKELKREWEKKSSIPYEGKDLKGNDLKYTLYRYLTSKGLTKDSAGFQQLSEEDIKYIECGMPNHLYARANFLEKRIYEFFQEYHYYKISKNPQGKTMVLRMFYWKLATQIWWENFWIGVGTGDVQDAFEKEYHNFPNIPKSEQLRAHNQILTIALTFGIVGLLTFLWGILYPLLHFRKLNDYMLYFLFFVISLLSFLIDDTLETQPGVTFYALYNTLIIKWLTVNQSEES